jgi:hypothetical protein
MIFGHKATNIFVCARARVYGDDDNDDDDADDDNDDDDDDE